ncbi:phf-14 [Pristionchus pacificus]|uniref:Phf-14 n=1 Tax=Pristionchus pacificus TaxID=54126 RepID=A0A2A6CSB0_PRIPA|nr:phf-14 [Pristionchus pacificus]|eukprot:PDM80957.1 phf-14 [Pristionchus pacificus]
MTEAERNSFFAHSTELSGSGSENSSSESSEDSSGDEDDEKEGGENDEDADYLKSLKDRGEENDEDAIPLCSLCLNLRPNCAKEEVIQCDKCGVAVHESCYGMDPEIVGDDNSTESASITEPWFCEPCIYGEKEPPHCELCPVRYGALKRSDIGGCWVHLLCALYTPGITFGDVERLAAISWQEIDYKQFGKRACSGCNDRLESRTGIVVECDAALCKNFYHPTCAQRLGLLVDRSDEINEDEEDYHDERFIHCKKHSHEDEVRKKREAYAIFIKQEENRYAMLKRKKLNDREEEKLARMEDKSRARYRKMEGVTISVPDASWDKTEKKNRRARHLHTSSQFLEAFSEKADLAGVRRDEFEKAFIKVDGRTLSFLPPAFSPEFVAYFNHREKHVMNGEKNRLERVTKERDVMREEQKKKEAKYHELENSHKKAQVAVHASQERIIKIHSILTKLGAKKMPKINEIVKKEPATPRSRLLSRSSCHDVPSTSRPSNIMKNCATCSSISDQHLLVECDACHKHYHLQCLDPPLERMPKKKSFEWHCMECAPESSEDEGNPEKKKKKPSPDKEESHTDELNGARKLRHRSDSVKQRKQAEKEAEQREYRSAMVRGSNSKRVVKPNKRYSTETPPPHVVVAPLVISLPIHSPIPSDDEPPSKRGRGRPKKTPSLPNSPDKNGRHSMETSSISSKRSRPSLSPQGHGIRKVNGRVVHDSIENGEEEDEELEEIVIIKE